MFRMKSSWVLISLTLISAAALTACAPFSELLGIGQGGPATAIPTPTVAPSATPAPLGAITGRLWHDLCAADRTGATIPANAPIGCVPDSALGLRGNGIYEVGEPGIEGVLVQLGLGACPAAGAGTVVTAADGSFQFPQLTTGSYCVSIDPNLQDNRDRLQLGLWTYPAALEGLTSANVQLDVGQFLSAVDFGWDHALLPYADLGGPTATPVINPPTPVVTPGGACVDRAAFVADVTIPDNSILSPGAAFEKIWRVKNAGTCRWTGSYALVFSSGDRLGGASPTRLSGEVAPGSTVDLKLRLQAPTGQGTYRGNWLLANAQGGTFGVDSAARSPVWVQIVVGPTSGAGGPIVWRGEYFSNAELKGSPSVVRNDAQIDFDWKRNAPVTGVPADNFSVRWSGKAEFEAAVYRFKVLVDDGARLYLDDVLVLSEWKDGSARELVVEAGLTKGSHSLRLEYYEHTHDARVRLRWEKVSSPSFSDWKGEYFSNLELKGTPALTRNDKAVEFNWGNGSPSVGLPSDQFSARWTRMVNFESGVYRFNARSDDGVRIFLGGQLILNEWHDSSGAVTYSVDRSLDAGKQELKVEYYERSGKADIRVWWERLTPTPTATASPTPTVTPSVTPTELPPTLTPTPTETVSPPTATPSPTPTETAVPPTATPTETASPPTATPVPQTAYEFSNHVCDAEWRSGAGVLACPGKQGDHEGYVLKLVDPLLEGELAQSGRAILTHPQLVEDGVIKGRFPAFSVEAGDRFRAVLGCLDEERACNVMFQLRASVEGGPMQNLASWTEVHDGKLTTVDLDLSLLAGKSVRFVITVLANDEASGDAAVWVNPRIVR